MERLRLATLQDGTAWRAFTSPDNRTYYWNEAYKNFKLKDADKMKYIQAGLSEVDKALALKPDYFEALTYKNLLLRSQALVEKDPAKQQALLKEADQLRDKAQALQKQKQAAAAPAPSKG